MTKVLNGSREKKITSKRFDQLPCFGKGKADKLAEIIAAVVLAGDVSLSCAILAHEWVSSHERLGRNR